ncbi:MAG: bifunctional tRNA (adenosine(37)-N6)-threonylcarbamoyltransferase complex ATPase subunit type 1 TsaE/phosphotransferase [Alphaproteobacteria bacterium]|nr:MAG: bifunctional tRNA (adenosine(37)-N6)-threonylcarbamoyltransferase complex ATPase subunit type 1 TsaE/phosphotransferase [Alphaproteobacteria bacterium]
MDRTIRRRLEDETATEQLGADIAMALSPGDVLALRGGLGAGKTTLARGLIRQLAGEPDLEVPSPTYTLCQSYFLAFPLHHFDLYRIGDPAELTELGLAEAMETGVVLVEWPERAPDALPAHAVTIELDLDPGGGRTATISATGDGDGTALARIARSLAIRAFLDLAWGRLTRRRFLQGDASARRYETVARDSQTRILMDSPRRPDGPPVKDGKPYSQIAHLAEDVVPFIAVDLALRRHGFAAPRLFAGSIRDGLLLIEHLGSEGIVDDQGHPVAARYREAARLLARLHAVDWPARLAGTCPGGESYDHRVPDYDAQALVIEASLLVDWYVPAFAGQPLAPADRQAFTDIWTGLAATLRTAERTLVLRDYHSPNLIWRASEPFPANLGLIDFQDAVFGPTAYDVVSLAQDARVDVTPGLEAAIVAAYVEEHRRTSAGFDEAAFDRDRSILGAQRATKILGIFVRLDRRDGKPAYLRHLPRMRAYLARNLAHPALAEYRRWCAGVGGIILPDGDS